MNIKQEVKELWKRCFNDNDEFVDMYFEKRYKDDINMCICEDGKVVSALLMIPYPMTFCGEQIPTSYISGACTHPDYRKRGLMCQLLTNTHRRMYKDNVWLSTLIPAKKDLFDYYAKVGYAPTFGYTSKKIQAKNLYPSSRYVVTDETDNRELMAERYYYFATMMKKRPCCIQHPREDFLIIMEDLRLSRGSMLVARQKHHIVGMAFCVKTDDGVLIKELLGDDDTVKECLLAEAARLYKADEVNCLLPSFIDSLYLGMSRVIHVEKFLQLITKKYPNLEMYIYLTDDEDIPENNGHYTLRDGRCIHEYCPDKMYWHCNIRDFTRLLLTAEHPYMSLMCD